MWRPADLGHAWRQAACSEIMSVVPRTWLERYQVDAVKTVQQVLSRVETALTRNGGVSLAGCGRDAAVTLELIEPTSVSDRGDRRYGSYVMAEFLMANPGLDLVPIIIGTSACLDGHHRLRAYALAERKALAFRVRVTPGDGTVRFESHR